MGKIVELEQVTRFLYQEVDRRLNGRKIHIAGLIDASNPESTRLTESLSFANKMETALEPHGIYLHKRDVYTATDMAKRIAEYSEDNNTQGIFIFGPTDFRDKNDNRIDTDFAELVPYHKDVEGVSPINDEKLSNFQRFFDAEEKYKTVSPCTPMGLIKAIQLHPELASYIDKTSESTYSFNGRKVGIINDGPRIGLPFEKMVKNLGAEARIFNNRTENLAAEILKMDILLTATPVRGLVRHVRQGTLVIDPSFISNLGPAVFEEAGHILTQSNYYRMRSGIGALTIAMVGLNAAYLLDLQEGAPKNGYSLISLGKKVLEKVAHAGD
jgi:5,10-methylene-tetrahydrofolate dehydrogenase/methenyl tetrahydrofolate cyclohydrolase